MLTLLPVKSSKQKKSSLNIGFWVVKKLKIANISGYNQL